MAALAINYELLKCHQQSVQKRYKDKISRTDRLDGGAKLEEKRKYAEKHSPGSRYGKSPQELYCYNCGHTGMSSIKRKSGRLTWLLCLGCCCCWAPFADCTKDSVHRCSKCKTVLGEHKSIDVY